MYVICIQLVHICTVLGLREDFGKYYASWCLDKDLTNVLWTVDDALGLEYLFFPNEISTPVFSPLTNDWICRNIQSSYVCIWLVIIKKLYRTNLAKCYRQGISFTVRAVEILNCFFPQPTKFETRHINFSSQFQPLEYPREKRPKSSIFK
jgi:hypothetical protein